MLGALFAGDATRAELARRLDITRSTVGSLVEELVDAGLVRERAVEIRPARAPGRPGTRLALVPGGACFLGASVGVDGVTVVALDLAARTLHRAHEAADGRARAPADTATAVARLIGGVAARLPRTAAIAGAGVAVPGFLDADGGCHAALLGWRGAPLHRLLRDARPAIPGPSPAILNDADAVAAAEHRAWRDPRTPAPGAGGAIGEPDVAVVLLEHGVGLGVVRGGRLPANRRHGADELGHLPTGRPGWLDGGGHPERLEAHVGRDALLARWRSLGGSAAGGLDAFVATLGAGDPVAARVADGWALALAQGLAGLVALVDVERIALAGSVAALHPFVADRLARRFAGLLPPGRAPVAIARSRVREDGAAVGAALALHRAFLDGDAPPVERRRTA